MFSQRFVRDVLPVLAWMGVIFALSTHAGSAAQTNSFLNALLARFCPGLWRRLTWPEIDGLHYYVRKTAHVTEYAVLGFLMMRAFRSPHAAPTGRPAWLAWALGTLYAATDEFHQIFVPGRTAKVTDVLLDSCGAMLGVALVWLRARRRERPAGMPPLQEAP